MRDSNHDVVGTCEAIVTSAVFRQTAERLDKSPKRGPENIANKALLISHLFCVKCKSPMYKVKTGATEPYYRCSGKLAENRKPCGVMIHLSVLDSLVGDSIAADDNPILKWTLIPGKNYDDDLDQIDNKRKALSFTDPDYQAKYDALVAEYMRVKDLDTTPDDWDDMPTGETYGGKWTAADFTGKRDMLKDITVYAGKNDRGEAWALVEIMGKRGLIRQHVAGNPPGPTLLERGYAKGIDKLVDADASLDD